MMMKKNVASLLLALVLCLSLLPAAALAEGESGAYQTGLYTAASEDGTPSGPCTEGSRPTDGPWGYWDIPYTSGSTTVLYYYDAETTAQAGCGDFTAGFEFANGGFPISFKDQYTSPAPAPGLYYKELVEGPRDPLHEVGDYIPLDSIDCAPFVDRMAFALYYCDGNSYSPVERVCLPQGSAFDLMWVPGPQDEGHWYYLSAYDFTEGTLEWFADPNANTPTDSITLNSHHFPYVAFYSSASDISENTYRMYALMDTNTSTEEGYRDYRYSATLYVLSTHAGFTFSESNDISCYQKHYDQKGFEMDETSYTDFAYTCERSSDGKTLTFTIYANDSDLLVWLRGDGYGAYVNFLADTGSGLYLNLNSQGEFAAAKFLPRHLFLQAAKKGLPVTLSAGDFPADVTCDKDLVRSIAAASETSNVALEAGRTRVTSTQKKAVDTVANADTEVVDALDITLSYGGEAQHELNGTAAVSYPCNLPNGTTVQVYYVDDNGNAEPVNAVYQDGQVVFSTSHFSKFVIVTVPVPSPTPSHDERNNSTPSYQVKIDAEGIKADHRIAEEGELVTLTVKDGYNITDILVTDRNGNPVKVTYQDGKYIFRMPKGKITVTPIYASVKPTFTDVDSGYWASDAIEWVAEKGYMTGVSDTAFAPEGRVSRQQVWMILARLSGAEPVNMAEAKAWAMANGVSDGTAPGAAVTRQQMVTLLYRYAVLMGYDVSVGEDTNILSYEDAFSVSEYAVPAFQWACGAGIVGGITPDTLAPQSNATRAQFAVILSRFCGESA